MRSEMLSHHPLAGLFQARSVALIGASDRSPFSVLGAKNFDRPGFERPVHMVNLRGTPAHGRSAVTSCRAIETPVDAAYICVPQTSVLDAVTDAADAGIKNFVIVSAGFAEAGDDGIKHQSALVDMCRSRGLTMLGPNCLGFVNYVDGIAIGSIPAKTASLPASIALVSNSGATVNQLRVCAEQLGVGATHVFATGNESMVDTAAIMDYLIDDPAVRAVALFVESIRDPATFIKAAARANAAHKPIVVLKLGAAENTAAVAAAHTGALVGDDRVFDAMCRRHNIIRVSSIEQLITAAAIAAVTGPLRKPGMVFVSQSGGACGLISDAAGAADLPLPHFASNTMAELASELSAFGHAHNPLDLTGAVVPNPGLYEKVIKIVARDPDAGLAVCHYDLPEGAEISPVLADTIKYIAAGLKAANPPGLMMTSFTGPLPLEKRNLLQDLQIPLVISGIDVGVKSLAAVARWSTQIAQRPKKPAEAAVPRTTLRPTSERAALGYLERCGVPVIPTMLARDAASAIAAARNYGAPVAMKIASPDIAHKTDVGGVKLNVSGDSAVEAAYSDIMASVRRAIPHAQIDGVAVSPMRRGGVELFVGVTRDAQWGPVLAIGIGGVWVEVLKDTNTLLLPASREDVVEALTTLRAAKLLQGHRGSVPVDLPELADIVVKIGNAALALGPELAAFEINPLLVDGKKIEALDALAVWQA